MAKLQSLKSGLSQLTPHRSHASRQEAEKERLAERDRSVVWRAWYRTKRWYALRLRVFERDKYTCQKTGVLLVGRHPAPNSPVAHHKIAHRGDPVLFWDDNNVETVAKEWHDSEAQAQEARERCI